MNTDSNYEDEINQVRKNPLTAYVDVETNLHDMISQSIKATRQSGDAVDYGWVKLKQSAAKLILETIADDDKRKILKVTLDTPMSIMEILSKSEMPQTSGYRRIKSLIKNGFLIPNNTSRARSGRKIIKYTNILENIKINMEKDKLFVKVKFAQKQH